ncbi:Anaerobic sulfatase-maturating enzyme [Tannerella forsythia]|uniref:Anaerobic sulfatase-maturating enzyme n=2 Tax=Tannerella forsythia TaxID=28112 RepID=A0A1D3UMS5_TANFO|nr:Anaerobic sulfatase-maturating enzyme [Tannerella forsythia]
MYKKDPLCHRRKFRTFASMNMKPTLYFTPLSFPIYVMAKPVGALCNMDCEYCYYLEKSGLYQERKQNRMSDETLERFTQAYIECQTSPFVQFTWHGGESLLRGLDFYRKALKFQRQYGRGREIQNCIQTNGLLLNDEWCRFFKDNDFLVGISIDGPEAMHDRYRKDCGGRGTFARVMRGIERLHRHGVEFNTLSVLHDYNVRFPLEMYHFFKDIGSRYMQFSPIVERLGTRADGLELLTAADHPDDCEPAPWSVDPIAYGDFYIAVFDEWVRHDVGQYYIQLFDATLAGTLGEPPGVCIYAKTCGHALAMEYNGDVYACDHFVYPEYRRGNLYEKTLVEITLSDEQRRFGNDKRDGLPAQCRSCRFLRLCNGECPKNRIAVSDDGEYSLNYLCAGLKRYFAHVEPAMAFMAEELRNGRPPANIMHEIRR